MRRLLVTSHKGGVGKTTSLINVAALLARSGRRVLVVDCDPLQSVYASLALPESTPRGLTLAVRDHDSITSTQAGFDLVGPSREEFRRPGRIPAQIETLSERLYGSDYDLVMADTQPIDEVFFDGMFSWADEALIVERGDAFSYAGMADLLSRVQRWATGSRRFHGIVVTAARGDPEPERWHEALRRRLPEMVCPDLVPQDRAVGRCLVAGLPVALAAPGSKAARAYQALAAFVGGVEGDVQ